MEIILALFVFQQIPVTYADTIWPMYGATLENTHFQKMVGAMVDTPYVKWSYVTGGFVESQGAAVADVDGDDTMEVVIGSNDHKVYCLNGLTGAMKWSHSMGGGTTWEYSSPTIADVDGDDTMEIVIGSMDSTVYCLNGVTGLVKWSYPTGSRVYSSPAVADVDRDDTMEIVIGSDVVYCLNGVTGGLDWSYSLGYEVYRSSPAIADVDRDDTMEVVIGSDVVYCLNGVTGTMKWSSITGKFVESSPAVADVDGDNTMEIIFGGGYDSTVYCLDGVTGIMKWSYPTGGWVQSSPAVADVEGNGTMEVIIGSHDGTVYCLNGATGLAKWSYPTGDLVHRGVSVADLDGEIGGECKLEVLVPSFTNLLTCLNGEDGSVLWTKQLAHDIHDITIADIDNDGCVELIVGTEADNKIWALDDVGNHTDCKCDASGIEEKRELRVKSLEFRVMGRGVYLFTPNAVEVDIKLYDVCGRLQQIFYKGVLSKGGHTFTPNINSSGIYFVILRGQKFKKSIKLINFVQ